MNRRLVVVSYHFGPAGPVGGLRWWALTKYLARAGWGCRVVSATDASRQGAGDAAPPGVVHEHVPPARTLGVVYGDFRRGTARNGARPESTGGGTGAAANGDGNEELLDPNPRRPTGVAALRSELAALLDFPDEGRGWIARASRAARRAVGECEPCVVISSGPPHSAHIATWAALRGRHDTRWLMDLRDPWSEADLRNPNVPSFVRRSRWMSGTVEWLERRTLEASAGFITTTPELAEVLARRHSAATPYCLTNGVDEEWLPSRGADPYPGFSVAHVGTLYARRDPRPLLRAFRRFLEEVPSARADGSCVRFAGTVEGPYQQMLDSVVTELGLEKHVKMLGLVAREEALRVLRRSSVAVVLTQDQLLQIPAKLYEPVAMGLPTLVLATAGSATAVAAERLGVPHAEPDDVDEIASCFHSIHDGRAGTAKAGVAREIHYETLARDAARILLHDPAAEERPSPPAWITR